MCKQMHQHGNNGWSICENVKPEYWFQFEFVGKACDFILELPNENHVDYQSFIKWHPD